MLFYEMRFGYLWVDLCDLVALAKLVIEVS